MSFLVVDFMSYYERLLMVKDWRLYVYIYYKSIDLSLFTTSLVVSVFLFDLMFLDQ